MATLQQNYVAGAWIPAAATAPNVNPSNTADVIADYARASRAEIWRFLAPYLHPARPPKL